MATTHTQKIGSVATLSAGATFDFQWNNPPWDTVLAYTAYPNPPHASGPHGSSSGTVEVTRVAITYVKDNFNGDSKRVHIFVKNSGSSATGFDLWESWVS